MDTISPIIVSLVPSDDAQNVGTRANLVITFDEPVRPGSGNITIRRSADDSVVEAIDVTSAQVTAEGNSIVVDPSADLDVGVEYYVQISEGAITDTASTQVLFTEDFESLPLQPFVSDTEIGGDGTDWTDVPPEGWTRDNTTTPEGGPVEFFGWTFLDKESWATTAGDQDRNLYTNGTGTVMVADPDEYDDGAISISPNSFNAFITTPDIDLTNIAADTLTVTFDSSWRPEDLQRAGLSVSYDGGEAVPIFEWTSDPADPVFDVNNLTSSPTFKPDGLPSVNETLEITLNNPADASTASLTFGVFESGNDWWWAVDNIVVAGDAVDGVDNAFAGIDDSSTWNFTAIASLPPEVANPLGQVAATVGETQVVDLFDLFEDADNADTELTYQVVNNSNPDAVTVSEISATDGQLSLTVNEVGLTDITVEATDPNGSSVTSTFQVKGQTTDAFVFAVLGDTQDYSTFAPEVFEAQTQWLVDNRDALGLEFVVHVGDVVNANNEFEWMRADGALSILDGEVPYAILPGNHDMGAGGSANVRDTDLLNQFFPVSRFEDTATFGGVYDQEPDRYDNNYHTFTAPDGTAWMVLSLEFGPRDDVLRWANEVVAAHPDHRVIISTHDYLNFDQLRHNSFDVLGEGDPRTSYGIGDSVEGANDGDDIWNKFVRKHPNISFVFGGHICGDGGGDLISYGDYGNPVHQILVNYQRCVSSVTRNGVNDTGYIRLFTVNPSDGSVVMESYSPVLDTFNTELEGTQLRGQQFVFENIDLGTPNTVSRADAGDYQVVTAAGETAAVTLDGSGTSDSSGDGLQYQWTNAEGNLLATEATPTVDLPVGINDLTLTITDTNGITNSDTVTVAVQNDDTLLYEDFNDGNFDGWTALDQGNLLGNWYVTTDGQLYESSNSFSSTDETERSDRRGPILIWDDAAAQGWTDYVVDATLRSTDNDGIGIVFRYQDENNYYKLDLDTQTNIRALYKVQGGVETTLAIEEKGYPFNVEMDLQVAVVGKEIVATLNGESIFDAPIVDNNPLIQGTIGLYSYGQDQSIFDNIMVNLPTLTAQAGRDQTVSDRTDSGTGTTTLQGAASFANSDAAIASYEWILDDTVIATGINPTVTLPVGENRLTLQVTDSNGTVSTDEVVVTVKSNDSVLLFDDFNDQTFDGWAIIDQGTENGPSNWNAVSGSLGQFSDIASPQTTGTNPNGDVWRGLRKGTLAIYDPAAVNTQPINFAEDRDGNGTLETIVKQLDFETSAGDLSGLISYNQELLTGLGTESLNPANSLELDIDFFGTLLTEEDDFGFDFFPQLIFENGVATGLEYQILNDDLAFSVSSVSGDLTVDFEQGPSGAPTLTGTGTGVIVPFSDGTGGNTVDPAVDPYTLNNYALEATLNSADDDGIGLLFYYQDENNYYKLELDADDGFSKLVKLVDGIETTLARVPNSYASDTDLQVRVEISDVIDVDADGVVQIQAFVDGEDLFGGPITDSDLANGTVGLYSWGSAGVRFDNVEVTSLADDTVLTPADLFITSLSPEDDATNVAVDADLVGRFNRDVQTGSGNIVIRQASDDSVVETIDVNSDQVTVLENTVTVDAIADLAPGTDYYVQIEAGALEDPTGITTLFFEDFEDLATDLGPFVSPSESGGDGTDFTNTLPDGWSQTNTTPAGGPIEFFGWTFLDASAWVETAGDQNRSQFTNGSGVVAVADPDEYDDGDTDIDPDQFQAAITTPEIDLTGVNAGSAILTFDSSWRPEDLQKARVTVSFDGGEATELLLWTSDPADANFKPDATNETLALALDNPEGATNAVVTFEVFEAGNDWWWAVDNIEVKGSTGEGQPFAGISDDSTWNFSTRPLDTQAPRVISFTPADNGVDVAVDSNLAIQFDEPIQAGVGTVAIATVADDTIVETIDITSDQITISGDTVIIDPANDLANGTDYYVQVDAGAIQDTANNPAAGISNSSNWNFATVESADPDLINVFFEDFESLSTDLGPFVSTSESGGDGTDFTNTLPDGWSQVNNTPAGGPPEFFGWTFLDANSWTTTAGDQNRSEFTRASGVVAVADPDEYDDGAISIDPDQFQAALTTPEINLSGAAAGTARVSFDSSWRPEDLQKARLMVSFDGGEAIELFQWTSTPADATFKPDATNERVIVDLNNPEGATNAVLTFEVFDGGNDWWWAIDNISVDALPVEQESIILFTEDFESLEPVLGPLVSPSESGGDGTDFTATLPEGWSQTNDTPTGGPEEFFGWTFFDFNSWVTTAGDQDRSQFTNASGVIAVADPDEYDDGDISIDPDQFQAVITTPDIDLMESAAGTVEVTFDSSWRPEDLQKARLMVSFDGAEAIEIFQWTSTPTDATFKPDAANENLTFALDNPEGASTAVLSFEVFDGGNDWWWAIDNIVVSATTEPIDPVVPVEPVPPTTLVGVASFVTVGETGDDILVGDVASNIVASGLGDDIITGGNGSDTFILAIGDGTDTIVDFEVGTDLIGLTDGLTFEQLSFGQRTNAAVISVGDEDLALLNGVAASALTESVFTVV